MAATEHVPRVRGVRTPAGDVEGELVPEDPGRLVGVAGAADVVQQRGVEGRPDVVLGQVERPGEPGGSAQERSASPAWSPNPRSASRDSPASRSASRTATVASPVPG
jgi:hypothetical protein